MTDVIRVDYEALQQIAAKFGKEAEAIEALLTAVRGAMDPLESGWVGEGSVAFFDEMNREILPALRRLAHALNQASQITNQSASVMQQAEEEASSPFRVSGSSSSHGGIVGRGGLGGLFGGGFGSGSAGGLGGFLNSLSFGGSSIGSSGSLGAPYFGSEMFNGSLGSGLFSGDPFSDFSLGQGLNSNDFGIPRDWLSGVKNSLNGFTNDTLNDYGIPHDWLGDVLGQSASSPEGGTTGMAAGGGASGGGGSTGGNGSGEPGGIEPTESEPTSTGGGSGGSSAPSSEFKSPYGSGTIPRQFSGSSGSSISTQATPQASGLLYRSLGPVGGGAAPAGNSPAILAPPAASVASAPAPPAAGGKQSNSGIALGLAAISPFVALLGKAISDDDD